MIRIARSATWMALVCALAAPAQAARVEFAAEAFGIDWTAVATDEGDTMGFDLVVSLTAEIPTDLDLIVEEGDTISPTWITTAEVGIQGLESDFRLLSAPGADGAMGWDTVFGPAANGCQDRSGVFVCSEATSDANAGQISAGASLTWTWGVNVDGSHPIDDGLISHIGAQLQNERHRRGWIISEPHRPIPEPGSALLFGVGLVVTGWSVRRRVD